MSTWVPESIVDGVSGEGEAWEAEKKRAKIAQEGGDHDMK